MAEAFSFDTFQVFIILLSALVWDITRRFLEIKGVDATSKLDAYDQIADIAIDKLTEKAPKIKYLLEKGAETVQSIPSVTVDKVHEEVGELGGEIAQFMSSLAPKLEIFQTSIEELQDKLGFEKISDKAPNANGEDVPTEITEQPPEELLDPGSE